MTALESQLQASIDIIELRKRDSSTLAAVIKAAQAELSARRVKLRVDCAELAKQRKALQRRAAELAAAGQPLKARAPRKDKGVKKGPKRMTLHAAHLTFAGQHRVPALVRDEDADAFNEHLDAYGEREQLNLLDKAADDAECADADARDDYERQNAARGNEP